MENQEIITGGEGSRKINVMDMIGSDISPDILIDSADPDVDAVIDPKEVVFEKYGKNFETPEQFDEFYNYAENLTQGYNYANGLKRQAPRPGFWYGAQNATPSRLPTIKSKSMVSAPITGGKWQVDPRQIARDKGTYMYKDPKTGQDIELPIDPASLRNPLNNYVIDGMENGDPYMRLLPASTYDPSYQRYSIWGDDSLYGMAVWEPIANFVQEAILTIPTLIAFGGKIGHDLDQDDFIPNITYEGNIYNAALNVIERLKHQPSMSVQSGGWFDDGLFSNAFFYNLGGGLGMLAPQRWAAKAAQKIVMRQIGKEVAEGALKVGPKASGAFLPGRMVSHSGDEVVEAIGKKSGKTVTAAEAATRAAKAAGAGMVKPLVSFTEYNYLVQNAVKKAAYKASITTGTGQALRGFHDEALLAGLSEQDAALWTLAAAPAVALTELLLSAKYLTKGIGDDAISPTTLLPFMESSGVKALRGYFQKMFPEYIKANGSKLFSGKQKSFIANSIIGKALKPASEAVAKFSVLPVAGGALREGTQEMSEQAFYIQLQQLYNATHDKSEGYFKNKAWSDAGKELSENFWAGAILGGIMDGASGSYKVKSQERFIESMVVNGQKTEFQKISIPTWQKGGMGSPGIMWNGEQEKEGAPGSGVKINKDGSLDEWGIPRDFEIRTLNDMNYYNLIQKWDITEQAYNMGVHNIDSITAYGEDPSILHEVLGLSKQIIGLKSEITDLQAKEKELENGDAGQLNALKETLAQKKTEYVKTLRAYNDATVPTMPDAEGNIRYTKRANEKLAEILFSEMAQKKTTIQQINESRKALTDFAAWKKSEYDKEARIRQYQQQLQQEAEAVTFDGTIEDLDSLVSSIDSLIEKSESEGARFNAFTISPQAIQVFTDIQKSLAALSQDPALIKNLTEIAVKSSSMPEEQNEDNRAAIFNFKVKDLLSGKLPLDTVEPEFLQYASMLNISSMLEERLQFGPEQGYNIEIAEDWDAKKENEKTLEYFLTVDPGTGRRIDVRNRLIEINQNIEDATELELEEVKTIARKLKENEDTLTLAERINRINVNAGRRVVDVQPTNSANKDANGRIAQFGDEIESSAISTGQFAIDTLFNNILDFEYDESTKTVKPKMVDGKPVFYPGINELIEKLEGSVSKRSYREKQRTRGRIFRNIQMAQSIIEKYHTSNLFDESAKLLVPLIKTAEDVFKPDVVKDEALVEIQSRVFDLMAMMHKEVNDKGKVKEFLDTMIGALTDETSKYESIADPSIQVSYKGYTPVRDNFGINYDDFMAMPFTSYDLISEAIRTRNEDGGHLPSGYEYDNKDVRSAIFSMYVMEHTNFINQIAYLDINGALIDYAAAVKNFDKLAGMQQEVAILHAYMNLTKLASDKFAVRRNSLSLFGYDDNPERKKDSWLLEGFPLEGASINGINGAGKTTVVAKTIFAMLDNYIDRLYPASKVIKIITVSPTAGLKATLKEQFDGLKHFTVESMLDDEYLKNYKTISDAGIIVYDEATRFPEEILEEFVKYYQNPPDGFIEPKFLFLGDPTQSRNKTAKDKYTIQNVTGAIVSRAPTISEVYRTEIYDIAKITQELQKNIIGSKSTTEAIRWPVTTYLANHTEGVRYVPNATSVVNQWLIDINMPGLNRILVLRTANDRVQFLNDHPSLTEDQKKKVRFINKSKGATEEVNSAAGGTIQGSEVDAIYVGFELNNDDIWSFVDYKTAVGRAQKFVMLPNEQGSSVEVDNILKTNSDPDALKKETADKLARINAIAKDRIPYKQKTASAKSGASTTANASSNVQPAAKAAPVKKAASKSTSNTTAQPNTANEGDKEQINLSLLDKKKGRVHNRTVLTPEGNLFVGEKIVKHKGESYVIYTLRALDGTSIRYYMQKSQWDKMKDYVPPQQTSTPNPEDNVESPIGKFVNTARLFQQSGRVRVSLGASQEIRPFTADHYSQLAEIFGNIQQYSIEVDYQAMSDLYFQNTNERKPNYNVILVFAKHRENGKRTMIGSFYQPYYNTRDLKENFGKRSLSNHAYSMSTRVEYTGTPNNDALDAFNAFLLRLYSLAQQKGQRIETVGSGSAVSYNGGQARVNYSNPINVDDLLENVVAKGGYFLTKAGNYFVWTSDLSDNAKSRIVIQQVKDERGYVTAQMYMSYLPTAPSEDLGEMKGVRIELNGVKYGEHPGSLKKLNDDIEKLQKKIGQINDGPDVTVENVTFDVDTLLRESDFSKHLNFNRWLFRDKSSVADKSVAYALSPEFANVLSLRETYLNLNIAGNPKTAKEAIAAYQNSLAKVAKEINKNGYIWSDISIDKEFQELNINSEVFSLIKTPVVDLFAPMMDMEFTESKSLSVSDPSSNTGNGSNDIANNPGNINPDPADFLLDDVAKSSEMNFREKKRGIDVLTELFGPDFVNNNLEFTPNEEILGVKAWGAVNDFRMIIREKGGKILSGVEYHEATHYAMRHFISPRSRKHILEDAKGWMAANGNEGLISDNQASEWLAEVARGAIKPKSRKKSLWRSFVSWLNRIIGNFRNSGLSEQFLNDLMAGKFHGAKPVFNNLSNAEFLANDEFEENVDEIYNDELAEDELESYNSLISTFGNKNELNKAMKSVRAGIVQYSAFWPAYQNNKAYTLPETFDVIYNAIASTNHTEGFKNKLKDRGTYDKIIQLMIPSFNLSDREIEEIYSSDYETKDVNLRKRNLSKALQFIIRGFPLHSYEKTRSVKGAIQIAEGVFVNVQHNPDGFKGENIDWNYLHHSLIAAARGIQWDGDINASNPMDQWLSNLRKMAADYLKNGDNNAAANNILSFLSVVGGLESQNDKNDLFDFINPPSVRGTRKAILPITFLGNRNRLVSLVKSAIGHEPTEEEVVEYFSDNRTDEEKAENPDGYSAGQALLMRAKSTNEFLKALAAYSMNIITNDATMVEVEMDKNQTPNFSPLLLRSSIPEINKNNYKSGMEYAIYAGSEMVRSDIWDETSGINNTKSTYKIDTATKTIYVNLFKDNWLPLMTLGQDGLFDFAPLSEEFTEDKRLSHVREALRFLGLKNIHEKTVTQALRVDGNTIEGGTFEIATNVRVSGNQKGITRKGLASLIGGAMLAIRSDVGYLNAQRDKGGELGTYFQEHYDNIPAIQDMLSQLLKGQKDSFIPDTAVANAVDNKKNKQIKNIEKIEKVLDSQKAVRITSFDFMLLPLANMEASLNAQADNIFSVGPKGTRIFMQNMKMVLNNVFGSFENLRSEALRRDPSNPANLLPMHRLASMGKVFRPKEVRRSNGMKMYGNGKNISEFTTQDLINHDIFGVFYKSLYSTQTENRQTLTLPIPNPGDSNQKIIVDVLIDSRKGGLRALQFSQKNKRFEIPESGKFLFNAMMDMQMDHAWKMHSQALDKLSQVYIQPLDGSAAVSPFQFVQYNGTPSDIQAFQANLQILASGFSMYTADQLLPYMKAYGLIEGVHYMTKGNSLVPGLSVTFSKNRDNVYNAENYFQWKDAVSNSKVDLSAESEIFKSPSYLNKEIVDAMKPLNDMRSVFMADALKGLEIMLLNEQKKGLKIPEYVEASSPVNSKKEKRWYVATDRIAAGQKVLEHNPFIESFVHLYHFLSYDIIHEIMGDPAQMVNKMGVADITEYGKYFKGIVSQGNSPIIQDNPIFGLSNKRRIVILQDRKSDSKYAALFGINKANTHTDGLVISSDLYHKMYSHDLGGSMGMVRPGDTTVKSLTQTVNSEGYGLQIKSSKIRMNADMLKHHPEEYKALLKFMYDHPVVIGINRNGSQELYNPYQRWLSFYEETGSGRIADDMLYEEATKYRISTGMDVLQNIVHEVVFKSTVKTNSANENIQNLDNVIEDMVNLTTEEAMEYYNVTELDPTSDRAMLNANQPYSNQKAAAPIQYEEIAGDAVIDVMNGSISNYVTNTELGKVLKNKEQYFRGLLYNMIRAREDSSINLELARNTKISMTIPAIFGTLVSAVSSQFQKGIHKKTTGRKLVQEPSEGFIGFLQVTDRSTGESVWRSYDEVEKDKRRGDARWYDSDGESLVYRDLGHIRHEDAEGNDLNELIKDEHPEIATLQKQMFDLRRKVLDIENDMTNARDPKKFQALKDSMQSLIEQHNAIQKQLTDIRAEYVSRVARVTPGEVAMEWHHFDKFGVDQSKEYSLNEILTVVLKDGTSLNVRDFVKVNSRDYYKSHKDGLLEFRNWFLENMENISEKSVVYEALQKLGGYNSASVVNWFDGVLQSLAVFSVRVPTSLWGSTFVGEIVSITYDSPSVIYTSHEKNALDDSDYDIDQLTVLFRNLSFKNGRLKGFNYNSVSEAFNDIEGMVENGNIEDIENLKFQLYIETMLDPSSAAKRMTTFDTTETHEFAERLSPKSEELRKYRFHEYPSMVNNHKNSHDGKNLVAFAANAIHVVGTLMHLSQQERNEYLPGLKLRMDGKIKVKDIFGERETYLIPELAVFLQLAVDNVKHMVAGRLNFNLATVNAAIALIVNGNSGIQAFKILNHYQVKGITDKVLSSMSIDKQTQDLYDLVNRRLNDLESSNDEEALIKEYNDLLTKYEGFIKDTENAITELQSSGMSFMTPTIEGVAIGPEVEEVDVDGKSTTALYAQLKDYTDTYTALLEMGSDGYVEMKIDQVQESLRVFRELDSALPVAEFMYHASTVFSLYNSLPSTHVDNYTKRNQVEFALRAPFSVIAEGYNPLSIQKAPLPDTRAFARNLIMNRARLKDGFENLGVPKVFYKATQETLNETVSDFVNTALDDVMAREYKGVKMSDWINLQGLSRLQTGFDTAGAYALNKRGIFVYGLMPKGFKYRTISGTDIATNTREEALSRFKNFKHPQAIKIGEAGVDVPVENPDYYASSTKHVISKSDHVLSINYNSNSPGMVLTNREAASKMTKLNDPDFTAENLNKATRMFADNLFNAMVEKIKGLNADPGAKITFYLNIAGNSIDNLQRDNKTEAERYIEKQERVDKVGDLMGILRSNRALYSYYNTWAKMNDLLQDNFYQMSPLVDVLAEDVSFKTGGSGVLSRSNYVKLVNGLDAVMAAKYLQDKYADKKINLYEFGDFKLVKTPDTASLASIDQLPEGQLQLANPHHWNMFIVNFPQMVSHYVSQTNDSNLFLNSLYYDAHGNVMIRDVQNISEENMQAIRDDFAKLPESLKEMFFLYNLLVSGFKNNLRSLAPVLEVEHYIDYSESLDKIWPAINQTAETSETGRDSELVTNLKTNFAGNLIASSDIARGIGKKRAENPNKRPPFARIWNTWEDFLGLKHTAEFSNLSIRNEAYNDQQADQELAYSRIYSKDSGRINGAMPIETRNFTTRGVVKITDPTQMQRWASTGMATVHTRRVHSYQLTNVDDPTSFVYVYHELAKIVSATETSIDLQRASAAEDANARIKYREKLDELKKSDPDYIPGSFLDSRLMNDGTLLPRKGLQRLVKMLRKANPDLQIVEVTDSTTERPGVKGYVKDGIIHLNIDRVTYDTPVHEIMHPVLIGLLYSNDPSLRSIGEEFMNLAQDQIDQKTELYYAIKQAYPDLSFADLKMEIAVTISGFVSEAKISRLVEDAKPVLEKIGDSVKRLWDRIVSVFDDILSFFGVQDIINPTIERQVPNYSINSTYLDMINHLVDMVFDGRTNMLSREVEELALANIYDSRELNAPIKDVKSMEDALLLGGRIKEDVSAIRAEYDVNYIFNELNISPEKTYRIGTEEFEMSSYMVPGREAEARRYIRETIVPKINEMREMTTQKFIDFINGENYTDPKTIREAFQVEVGDKTIQMFSPSTVFYMLSIMEYGSNNAIHKLSKLKEMKAIYPGLENLNISGFEGSDPYVVIHSTPDASGKGIYDISLFDISAKNLNFMGRGLGPDALITDNFEESRYARGKGVLHKANLRAAKQVILTTQMMAIKKNNPTVSIRKAGVIELIPYRGTRRNAGKVYYTPIDMNTIAPAVKVLSEAQHFRALLSEEIKNVLDTPSLYEVETYTPDYLEMLRTSWENKYNNLENYYGDESVGAKIMKKRLTVLQEYMNNRETLPELLRAIRAQKEYIVKRRNLTSEAAKFGDIEHRMLVAIENSITAIRQSSKRTTSNFFTRKFKTVFQHEGLDVQNYNNIMLNIYARIVDEFKEGIKDLNEKTKPFTEGMSIDKAKRLVQDTSDNYFKHMFITENVDGVEVNTGRIHWDKNDPKTKVAMAQGTIKQADLDFANYILDLIEKNMKALIRQKYLKENRYTLSKDGEPDMELIDKAVDYEYAKNWTRGIVPVMTKTPNQMILSGNGKMMMAGFKKWFDQVANPMELFTELIDVSGESEVGETVGSVFLKQIQHSSNEAYGGDYRLKLLGLEYNNGGLMLMDETQNKAMSMNLYTIAKYLIMDEVRKRNIENDLLPAYTNAVMTSIAHEYASPEGDFNIQRDILKDSFTKNIEGRNPSRKDEKNMRKFAAFIRMFIRATTFNGVALSATVTATSAVANLYERTSNALANTAGNPYDMANIKEEAMAVKEIMRNMKKVKALEQKYQVVESDLYEQLGNQKYDITRMSLLDANFWHIGNRVTDLTARRVAFVAQMIHDGTWDAHDEEGNYDVKKDSRFYSPSGSQTEVQEALMRSLVQDLVKDRVPGQQGKEMPTRAYSYTEQRKLMMVGTEYGIGVFERLMEPLGKNDLWYNALMQFKNFANAAIGTRIMGKVTTIEGGKRAVKLNANGEMIRDEFGKIVAGFQEVEREGTWHSTARLFGESFTTLPIVGDMLAKIAQVQKPRTLKEIWTLSDLERRNLAKTALDAVTFVMASILLGGLMKDLPDDKKKGYKKYGRLVNAIKNGFMTSIIAAPVQMLDMATEIAIISNARRFFNIVMLSSDAGKEISYVVPFGGSARVISDIVNEE